MPRREEGRAEHAHEDAPATTSPRAAPSPALSVTPASEAGSGSSSSIWATRDHTEAACAPPSLAPPVAAALAALAAAPLPPPAAASLLMLVRRACAALAADVESGGAGL